MRWRTGALALGLLLAAVSPASIPANAVTPLAEAPPGYSVTGIDISNHQGTVDWTAIAAAGTDFAYAKATEGLNYTDPYYAGNLAGANRHRVHFGGYAYGRPDQGDPRGQADKLVEVGGYTRTGHGLPPMLDIEWPWFGGNDCYGLTPTQMVTWISEFVDQVRVRTGRLAMIYTNEYWWNPCTAGSTKFAAHPLFVARYGASPGTLPAGWSSWTIWQYTSSGSVPGVDGPVDQDVLNGSGETLLQLVHNPNAWWDPRDPPPADPDGCYRPATRQLICPAEGTAPVEGTAPAGVPAP
ncbi:GH25 family lysozyme [Micromonospora sp. CPCC 206060]|uniref:GH25 family lysozyme n=1 Tax=Micromonospora sp. CPCC 206060 TaxID=3122406 RepID=UPI002FF132B1